MRFGIAGRNRGFVTICRSIAALVMTMPAATAVAEVEPGYDIYARPGAMVAISPDRRLNLRCTGKGPMTVILESGLGFPSFSWRKVQPVVARTSRVCSYDRAGLGFSDPGPLPRSAAAIVGDLEKLVRNGGLKPPFVLVGSSLGSQPVRLFAFRHLEQVAGIVLVDPYVEGQNRRYAAIEPRFAKEDADYAINERRCLALLERRALTAEMAENQHCIGSADPSFSPTLLRIVRQQRLNPATARTVFSESQSLETLSEVEIRRETRSLGDMAIIVLTAEAGFADTQPFYQLLLAEQRRLHKTLAALSTRGEERLVSGADHVIQASHPMAVVDAIAEIIARAKAAKSATPL